MSTSYWLSSIGLVQHVVIRRNANGAAALQAGGVEPVELGVQDVGDAQSQLGVRERDGAGDRVWAALPSPRGMTVTY